MSSFLIRLSVFAIILAVVLSAPAERERRGSTAAKFFRRVGSGIKSATITVGKGVKKAAIAVGGVFSGKTIQWLFPSLTYKEADTVDKEAEIVLTRTEESIKKGRDLVYEGEQMLARADALERSLAAELGKRDLDENNSRALGIRRFIEALRSAAQDAIQAGQKVVGNSEKIGAAFQDAVIDISSVIADGVLDVSAAVVNVTISINKAVQVVQRAKVTVDNMNEGLGDAMQELQTASELVVEASQTFEEVGKRSLTLVQRVVELGKNLVEVFREAAQNIFSAAG